MASYMRWVSRTSGQRFEDYDSLWRFSVADPGAFWLSIWQYFQLGEAPDRALVRGEDFRTSRWFEGARVNYAEHLLQATGARALGEGRSGSRPDADEVVVVACSEERRSQITRGELSDLVARCRAGLARLGVRRGDRVAAYLPNGLEALVALLATASLGAIWSSCPPEFGVDAAQGRFAQIAPKVLIGQASYRYGGRVFDCRAKGEALWQALPSVQSAVVVGAGTEAGSWLPWERLLEAHEPLGYEAVPFDHPLWILYSSGTTGLPKPIVHGHGGMLLEHLKMLALHHDLGRGSRFFWFSTTGWMMWNYLVSGLAVGAAIVLYDGSPGYPDLGRLWKLVEQERISCFGVSAPFLMACRAAGLVPKQLADLSSLRSVGSTGAPLPPEGFEWVYDSVGADLQLASASGGTDVCTAFLAGCPLLPVYSGELQCRALGADVRAFDPAGNSLLGEVGELVLAQPMPCMPVGFYNDPDGARYAASYFEDFPGVWRHGDWVCINERGGAVISGRSDATLNRGGIRMGSSEFYRVVEEIAWVRDSLVVDTASAEGEGKLWLFVVPRPAGKLTELQRRELAAVIREKLSPRHVPDELVAIDAVPRTASGKKLEVVVKRVLLGADPKAVVSPGALQDYSAFESLLAAVGRA